MTFIIKDLNGKRKKYKVVGYMFGMPVIDEVEEEKEKKTNG